MCFTFRNKEKLPQIPQAAEATTPLDKSYSTLKKYSALASSKMNGEQQYSTFANDSRQSSLRSTEVRGSNGYTHQDLGVIAPASHLPASYLNPAYDNSMEGAHPTNPTV